MVDKHTKPDIMIRADASQQIGSGHVMRCLTLAEALRNQGANVEFICREFRGGLCDFIESEKGFPVHRLPPPSGSELESRANDLAHASWLGIDLDTDAQQAARILADRRTHWLIIDHYAIDHRWEARLRPFTKNIMVIDDLADRQHDCDVLLDQNFSVDTERYNALVPETCQKLLGPKYALLREEFREARATLPTRTGSVKRIFVFFGGVDLSNETAKALRAIQRAAPDAAVDVVIGAANPHRAELEQLLAGMPNARLHIQVSNMAALMADADLAIGAGGSTTWERCCLGLPSIVVTIAKNQEAISEAMAAAGYFFYLGKKGGYGENVLAHYLEVAQNRWLYHALSQKCFDLVDAWGALRVVRALQAFTEIDIREARASDCERIFAWRNNPRVRQHFTDPEPIAWLDHERWFRRVLGDQDVRLLVGEAEEGSIGVVRYDIDRSSSRAEVSIYLIAEKIGAGLGLALLRSAENWLKAHEPTVSSLMARVKTGNPSSRSMFERDHYRLDYLGYEKEFAF